MDILDNGNTKPTRKKLWTIKMLLVGGGINALTFLIATFWESLGFTRKETIWLAISFMTAFGVNLTGLILGFIELKKNPVRAIVGLIGNLLFVAIFILLVMYSLAVAP